MAIILYHMIYKYIIYNISLIYNILLYLKYIINKYNNILYNII